VTTREKDSALWLGRRLYAKWRRDDSIPLALRAQKAMSYAYDIARAQLYLRRADELASDARVLGRPIVRNEGRLTFGHGVVLRSIVAPIEIFVGPEGTMIVGNDTHLNSGGTYTAVSRIEIGERVEVAPYVSVYDTAFHGLYDRSRAPSPRPVIIEDDVWIGTKCTILPGVRIGRGAVIMANSLVTRNVEPFTIVGGVPAEQVAQLDRTRFVIEPTA
jgi:acetyltransferase-like isoleucine patch superfamily enzyme